WHQANPGPIRDMAGYRAFLEGIGYLVPPPQGAQATTANVDDELARQAGPQLVVPVTNARYALNAANARWGSLYDALYGTDALPEQSPQASLPPEGVESPSAAGSTRDGGATRGPGYNPVRGAKVIEYCRYVLDRTAPLQRGSHIDAINYRVVGGRLVVTLKGGKATGLAKPAQFRGHERAADAPSGVLLEQHGLPLDIRFDRSHPIGRDDPAGVCDLVIESAVSTILDLEDSVAVVDAADKVQA